jgi:hypothetical protein
LTQGGVAAGVLLWVGSLHTSTNHQLQGIVSTRLSGQAAQTFEARLLLGCLLCGRCTQVHNSTCCSPLNSTPAVLCHAVSCCAVLCRCCQQVSSSMQTSLQTKSLGCRGQPSMGRPRVCWCCATWWGLGRWMKTWKKR